MIRFLVKPARLPVYYVIIYMSQLRPPEVLFLVSKYVRIQVYIPLVL